MALVSIIVPIYKSEKFLDECINSILCQTFSDFELILVDDGSPDNSGQICDNYAKKDNRIIVIHKENGGVSSARNKGIEIANGEYICFVDSDDTLKKQFLQEVIKVARDKKARMVVCGYDTIKNDAVVDKIFFSKDKLVTIDRNEIISLINKVMISAPWGKLYKSDIIKKNSIIFPCDISLGEDLIFNLSYIDFIEKITVLNNTLYNYCIDNENSLVRMYRKDLLENNIKLNSIMESYFTKWNLDANRLESYYSSLYFQYENVMANTFRKENTDSFFEKLSYNKRIMKSKEFKRALFMHKKMSINFVYRFAYTIHSYSVILIYEKIKSFIKGVFR